MLVTYSLHIIFIFITLALTVLIPTVFLRPHHIEVLAMAESKQELEVEEAPSSLPVPTYEILGV